MLVLRAVSILALCVTCAHALQFGRFSTSYRRASTATRSAHYRMEKITRQVAANDDNMINIPMPGMFKGEQVEPNHEDTLKMGEILKDINAMIQTKPESAINVISTNLGFLLSRKVPTLTQMLLADQPAYRQDQGMMKAYMLILDFLEALGKETQEVLKRNQNSLRILLEATKISEAKIDEVIAENREQLTSQEFMMYLDSEIENQSGNNPTENLLVTVKLRLMDEMGRNMGMDVMMLPKLAAENEPEELQRKTIEFLDTYTLPAKELFVQTLQIMRKEMQKRYEGVDPMLITNLDRIEKIAQSRIELDIKKEKGFGQ